MARLNDVSEMPDAVLGDEIYLASYNRVKQHNGMWRKDFTQDGALVNEKISKDEIQSMGFVIGDDGLTIDRLGEMGFVPVGLDYGDLIPSSDPHIDYGDLIAGSESDINYGDLTDY